MAKKKAKGRNSYKIVRMFEKKESQVIRRGLTLDEAQSHCRNPETSSRTAKSAEAKIRTELYGRWFDGYEEE